MLSELHRHNRHSGRFLASCLTACWLNFCLCPDGHAGTGDRPGLFKPFTAIYTVHAWNMQLGQATLRLSQSGQDGREWLYEAIIVPQGLGALFTGTLHTRARWRWQNQKVVPLEFVKTEKGKQQERYVFDDAHKRLYGAYKSRSLQLDLPIGGAIDQNTLFIKLLADLRKGKSPTGTYQVISRGKLREYQIHDRGWGVLKNDSKKRSLRRIEREKRGQLSQRYWLNPAYHYLPVRIEKWKDGRRQQIIRLQKIVWRAP